MNSCPEVILTVNVISVGKIKEAAVRTLIAEYSKRISKFSKLNLIEVKDLASEETASEKDKLSVLEEEGKLILSHISDREYVIALAIEGDMYTSEKLASLMEKGFISGSAKVTFVIGGSLGLSEKVKNRANTLFSFSRLTFPHQLVKLMLLEQIYRSFKIIHNEPYHK